MALPDATALAKPFAPAEPYQRLYGVMSHEGLLAKPSDLYQPVCCRLFESQMRASYCSAFCVMTAD